MALSTRVAYLPNTTLGATPVELDGLTMIFYLTLKSPSRGLNQCPKNIMDTVVRSLVILSSFIRSSSTQQVHCMYDLMKNITTSV